jgi:hypothetical protein
MPISVGGGGSGEGIPDYDSACNFTSKNFFSNYSDLRYNLLKDLGIELNNDEAKSIYERCSVESKKPKYFMIVLLVFAVVLSMYAINKRVYIKEFVKRIRWNG